jgi:uncharacterized coiled-coil protein SlyX
MIQALYLSQTGIPIVMSYDSTLEIRLMHLEDQVNRMNLVMADQGRVLAEQTEILTALVKRLKTLEEGQQDHSPFSLGGPSETPPDGVNR